eukprot:TRINITY_DN4626_c0_g2_i14.p1 TRINITY_DN4626_c0_g2~~TRINITY_DN4626_c0_g2_i14.p1  ORF type:complete len:191 (-),score=46.72 TRINITY_DN4626_c0_g2_i14:128-700(-)
MCIRDRNSITEELNLNRLPQPAEHHLRNVEQRMDSSRGTTANTMGSPRTEKLSTDHLISNIVKGVQSVREVSQQSQQQSRTGALRGSGIQSPLHTSGVYATSSQQEKRSVGTQEREAQFNIFNQINDEQLWEEFVVFLRTLGEDEIYNKCITLVTLYYFFERRTRRQGGDLGRKVVEMAYSYTRNISSNK